jgi:hypothetical protein
VGGNSTTRGISLVRPLRSPSHDGRSTLSRELLIEHATVPVSLLRVRNVGTPLRLRVSELLIGDHLGGGVLKDINPSVSNTVRELLLLAPKDLSGQVRLNIRLVGGVECLTKNVLLHTSVLDLLLGGVNVHGNLKELLVQEGNTGLNSPGGSGLVGTETVGQVQVLDTSDGLGVELLLVGGVDEVEVSSVDLVGSLSGQNHLDSLSLDLSAQQVHGGRGTDGGDIVGLQVVDDVTKSVETLLKGEVELVVDGSEVVGDLLGGDSVGRSNKTDREGVEFGESSDGGVVVVLVDSDQLVLGGDLSVLNGELTHSLSFGGLAGSDRGNQGRVESSRQQNSVRNLSHQTLANGLLEGVTDELVVDGVGGNAGRFPPGGVVVAGGLASGRVVDMSGRERDDFVADGVKALQLRGEVNGGGVLGRPSLVEGGNSNGVTCRNCPVVLLVVKNEGEHTVEQLGGVDVMLFVLKTRYNQYPTPTQRRRELPSGG